MVQKLLGKGDNSTTELRKLRREIAVLHNIEETNVYILTFCDMNAPHAVTKKDQLCQAIAEANDLGGTRSVCILTLPDKARKSCPRGLADDERELEDDLWARGQHTDGRWIIPHTCASAAAEQKTNMRRFMSGRIVVNGDTAEQNKWLGESELCVSGRPMTNSPIPKLAKPEELMIPESLDPNKDLRMAERNRPNEEQIRAQKGEEVISTMLTSVLQNMDIGSDSALIVNNLTPHVEEHANAFAHLVFSPRAFLKADQARMHYISHTAAVMQYDYAVAAMDGKLIEHWKSGALKTPGMDHIPRWHW
jgi:hypothetical protein